MAKWDKAECNKAEKYSRLKLGRKSRLERGRKFKTRIFPLNSNKARQLRKITYNVVESILID